MSGSSSQPDRAGAREVAMTRDPLTEEFLRFLANERNASPRTLKAYRHGALRVFRQFSNVFRPLMHRFQKRT